MSNKIKNLLTDTEKAGKRQIQQFLGRNYDKKHAVRQMSDKVSACKKMVYYMPTFRESEEIFFDIMDLKKFRKFLKENKMLFCTKLHPKSKLRKEFDAISGDNILVIDADTDPYVFLEMADVLVTNYDLDEYLRDSREMYFDYEAFTPGEKAADQEALEKALLHACSQDKVVEQQYKRQREKMAGRMFQDRVGLASERLTRDVLKAVQGRKRKRHGGLI